MRLIFRHRVIADVHVVIVETDPVQYYAVNGIILNHFPDNGPLILLYFMMKRVHEVFVAVSALKWGLDSVHQ
ncbi:hypothetical protein D1872_269540 [compost metagenome]